MLGDETAREALLHRFFGAILHRLVHEPEDLRLVTLQLVHVFPDVRDVLQEWERIDGSQRHQQFSISVEDMNEVVQLRIGPVESGPEDDAGYDVQNTRCDRLIWSKWLTVEAFDMVDQIMNLNVDPSFEYVALAEPEVFEDLQRQLVVFFEVHIVLVIDESCKSSDMKKFIQGQAGQAWV